MCEARSLPVRAQNLDCYPPTRNTILTRTKPPFYREPLTPLEISFKRSRLRHRYCLTRIVETILCIACLITSLWMYLTFLDFLPVIIFLLLFIPFAYLVITLVDHINNCWMLRMRWHVWICFSSSASIFFFIGVGLILTYYLLYRLFALILYIITAIVFLLDTIYWIRFLGMDIIQDSYKIGKGDAPATKRETLPVARGRRPAEKRQQERQCMSTAKTITECECSSSSGDGPGYYPHANRRTRRKHKKPSTDSNYYNQGAAMKPRDIDTTDAGEYKPVTYGGTFHMSRDVAPYSTPSM